MNKRVAKFFAYAYGGPSSKIGELYEDYYKDEGNGLLESFQEIKSEELPILFIGLLITIVIFFLVSLIATILFPFTILYILFIFYTIKKNKQ